MTMLWLYLDFVLTDLDDFKSKDNFKQKRECNSAQFNLYWFFFLWEPIVPPLPSPARPWKIPWKYLVLPYLRVRKVFDTELWENCAESLVAESHVLVNYLTSLDASIQIMEEIFDKEYMEVKVVKLVELSNSTGFPTRLKETNSLSVWPESM